MRSHEPARRPALLLLLFRRFLRGFLRGGFLFRFRLRLCLGFFAGSRFHLLWLRFLLGYIGSLEALPAECNLRDTDRGERLPMSAKLLVLFLAFVMKDKDLCASPFTKDFADDTRVRLIPDLSFFA